MTVTINGTTGVSAIQDATVTSAKIVDGSVAPADLTPAATPVGVGQTWQNVLITPGRLINTNYTNSTGRPIQVSFAFNAASGGYNTMSVGGVVVARSYSTATGHSTMSAIVPDGAVYRCDISSGGTLDQWAELR